MEQRGRPRPVAAPPPSLLSDTSHRSHHLYRPQVIGGGGTDFDYGAHNHENDWHRTRLSNLPQPNLYQQPHQHRHQQQYETDMMMIQSPVVPHRASRTRTTTTTTTTAPSMMPVVGGETPVDLPPVPSQVLSQPDHHMMINNSSSGSFLGVIEAAEQPTTTTHLRQLPSMTRVMNSNNYKKSTANHQQHQMKLSDLNHHQPMPPLQVINPPFTQPAQTIRRSLPPMNCLVNKADEPEVSRHSLNANQQLNDYSSIQPIERLNYNTAGRQQTTGPSPHPATMRQLPIITPYGPKPINHAPLRELPTQNINANDPDVWPQTAGVQFMIKNMINSNSNNNININNQQQIKSSSNIAHSKPLAQIISNKPFKYNRSSINTTTNTDRPQRQLPIITKQGVLRLRPDAANLVSETNQTNSVATGGRPVKSYKNDSNSHYAEADAPNGRRLYVSQYDSQTDDEYSQNVSDDAAADSVQDRLSYQGDNIYESDSNVTSPKSMENHQMDVEEEGEEAIRDSQGEEEIEICLPEEEEETLPEEELEEEENYYDDTRQPTEDEAEAEYYSALATVPEEEIKPTDKDSSQDYDYGDDDVGGTYSENGQQINNYEGGTTSTTTSNNSINANQLNKLPTIIENGFEAQVLEYLAEKKGVRKTELFSVDEEPSSYNDEVETQITHQQSNPDHQMENDSEYLNNEMINNAVQKDYSEQAIERREELLKVNLLDDQTIDPMSYDIAGNDEFFQDPNSLEFQQQQQQQNFAHQQPPNIGTQKQDQYKEHQLNDQLMRLSEMTEDKQNHLLEQQQQHLELIQEEQEIKLLVPEMKISTESDLTNRNITNKQELYNDEEKIMNYDIEEEEDDDRILISPANDKTSLEQEEYDDQYRDINNLEDLDRRATNHVHAIDGHSKSMLNGIHQQRTINDYYDDDDLQAPAIDGKVKSVSRWD